MTDPEPTPVPEETGALLPPPDAPMPRLREDLKARLVGKRINEFVIRSRLGTGGFGVVYRAYDEHMDRDVALKILPPHIAKRGEAFTERFLREARSAAKLAHPNIVTIYQVVPFHETFYIAMELVDGGNLRDLLAEHGRFSAAEATRIIWAAADALVHAHRRGVIHRDIKPGNILLTSGGQVKVTDFGLARDALAVTDIVADGTSMGTPRYMAPEQALGTPTTAATDIYSLAATYYHLMAGQPPFDAADDREIMRQHVQAPVPDPRRAAPDLPHGVWPLLRRAMAKRPEDRFTSAEDFIEALDTVFTIQDADVHPGPAGIVEGDMADGTLLGEVPTPPEEAISAALTRAVAQREAKPPVTGRPAAPPEGADEDEDESAADGDKHHHRLMLGLLVGLAVVAVGAVVAVVLLMKG